MKGEIVKTFSTTRLLERIARSLNVTLHAGIGVDVGSGVRANLFVHQTVTRDPIAYGPAIGMTVSIPLGDRAQPGTPGTL